MAIKNIIFDLGGVLIKFDKELMLERNIPKKYQEEVEKTTFDSVEWQKMDSGELEFDKAVKIMCCKLPEEIRSNVYSMIADRVEQMPLVEEMTPIIEALYQKGYKLFVLSNCAKWFHSFFKEHIPTSDKFSGYVISADYKTLKPQKEIYNILLNNYSLKAEECFFVDDSPANIKTALSLGMQAHRFSFREIDKFSQAISHLL